MVVEIPEGRCPFDVLGMVLQEYGTQAPASELAARDKRLAAWRASNKRPEIQPAAPAVDRQPGLGGVRDASIEAHQKLKISGKLTAQQEQVVAWVKLRPAGATRAEIAEGTGLKINAVCGRVHELLHDFLDPPLRELPDRRRCAVTAERVNVVVST